MSGGIESYGPGPTMSGGGWSEGDPLGGDPVDRRLYRQFVRDLTPGEAIPEHPAASSGYGYTVDDMTFRAHRLHDGAGRDIDDEARAATSHLAGGDPVLAYLLAVQWAHVEGGPLIAHSDAIDASEVTGFVPGTLEGDVYTYDCVDGYRYEVEIDEDPRRLASEWYERQVPPPVRRLWEVMAP